MICNYCNKEFNFKLKKKYCSIKCRNKNIIKKRRKKQKENVQYPNALDVDKIILSHDPTLVTQNNDWVFSKLLSDWCKSKNTIYRANDRKKYKNGKKKKGNT